MSEFNIVELIQNSPFTYLSEKYNNKILMQIKETYTEVQQRLFVSFFYCYVKYNKINLKNQIIFSFHHHQFYSNQSINL